MLDIPQAETKTIQAEAQFPVNLVEAQERGAELFTLASELIVKTARAIWESQSELLRLETEQAAKAFAPPTIGEDPGTTMSAYCFQAHEQTDRMIAQMRRVNDLLRDCGWQLFTIYAESLRQGAKQFRVSPCSARKNQL
ncbi:MAG TPA: hypothetical protein VKA03_09520 [Methylovirgula sp.]|nr:hypothetical protein [Methylovirgula sp.]